MSSRSLRPRSRASSTAPSRSSASIERASYEASMAATRGLTDCEVMREGYAAPRDSLGSDLPIRGRRVNTPQPAITGRLLLLGFLPPPMTPTGWSALRPPWQAEQPRQELLQVLPEGARHGGADVVQHALRLRGRPAPGPVDASNGLPGRPPGTTDRGMSGRREPPQHG